MNALNVNAFAVSFFVLTILTTTLSLGDAFTASTKYIRFHQSSQFSPILQQQQQELRTAFSMSSSSSSTVSTANFCDLPGDPSLILTTNVDLGTAKLDIMKALSKAVAKHTGKPESYVAVSISDNTSMIFGGSDAPLALGCLYSIGSINMESNGAITSAVTDALESYGITADRIYINCFDVPRANVGWNRATFAG